jgi:hypothetical protein
MLAAGFTFPLLLHLALAYPSGQLRGTMARAVVFAVYLEAALAALGRALFRDPFFDPNCWANCTDNLFLLRSLPDLAYGIELADRWFTAAAAAALVTISAGRLLRDSGPARRALLPVASRPSCSRPRPSRTRSRSSRCRGRIHRTRPSAPSSSWAARR